MSMACGVSVPTYSIDIIRQYFFTDACLNYIYQTK